MQSEIESEADYVSQINGINVPRKPSEALPTNRSNRIEIINPEIPPKIPTTYNNKKSRNIPRDEGILQSETSEILDTTPKVNKLTNDFQVG